jgi:GT2 family glycosyltransferase
MNGSSSKHPALAAILIVYRHSMDDLRSSIDSLRSAFSELELNAEIIVVDNAGTVELGEDSGDLHLLRPGGNRGFAGGANAAVLASRSPYMFFVGVDSTVNANTIDLLINATRRGGDENLYMGVLHKRDRIQLDSFLPWTSPTTRRTQRLLSRARVRRLSEAPAGELVKVGKACGGAMFCARETYLRLQGFNEEFLAYGEDLDLSLRHRDQGGSIYAVAGARVNHDGGSLSDAPSDLVARCQIDGLLRAVQNNRGTMRRYVTWADLLLHSLLGYMVARLTRDPRRAAVRVSRFRELRRWTPPGVPPSVIRADGYPWS